MFHLFKKIYLAHENIIDVNFDRVVISQANGVAARDYLQAHHGQLLSYGQSMTDLIGDDKTYSSFTNMLDTLATKSNETGKKIVIYVDNNNFTKFIVNWYKTVLANPDETATLNLINSNIFRYKVFSRGRFVRVTNGSLASQITLQNYSTEWSSISAPSDRATFVANHKSGFNVELLLATYLNNGNEKSELKSTIQTLIKKDLEKYLYELKEIFFAHYTVPGFASNLNLAKTYDLSNHSDIMDDTTTYADLFLNRRIWNYEYMNTASTGENVNFSDITSTDITNFKAFNTIAGTDWSETPAYTNIKSDVSKLDFIDVLSDFTDTRLTNLIDTEATLENESGSFFSVDLETVNNYFVQSILQNKEDSTYLAKYSIS